MNCISKKTFTPITLVTIWIALASFFSTANALAQTPSQEGFYPSERLQYEVRFKWGLINGRAGIASIYTKKLSNNQWYRELLFNTTGIFNTVFSMRDTLSTLYGQDLKALRFEKRVCEDDYYLTDIIQYTYTRKNTVVRSNRFTPTEMKLDTIMSAPYPKMMLDMLSVYSYIRKQSLKPGKNGRPLKIDNILIPIGNELIPCHIYILGRDVVNMPWSKSVPAIKFELSIMDHTFNSGNSVEVWVSDDGFRIPLYIKAKLKIGYGVCRLLSHPYYH